MRLRPIKAALFHDKSDQAYTAVALGYRFPGYDSPDFAAGQILGDVLSSARSNLGGMPIPDRPWAPGFDAEAFPKAGLGIAFAAVPVSVPPRDVPTAKCAGSSTATSAPESRTELVEAAKLREISQLEFNANSIEGLALEWSQAVAVQGLTSPDDMVEQYQRVSVADVNRVLRTYVDNQRVVVVYAVPQNAGAPTASGQMAKENNEIPPSSHEPLPSWAQHVLDNLQVPRQTISPTDMTLPNGIRLIVQPESISHTVVVAGEIENNEDLQVPPGQEGVADVTAGLLPFGTTTYDRIAFQTELDKIAASTEAGTSFGLDVLSSQFDRGMQLLADEELHPAFRPADFAVVQQQTGGELAGEMTTPQHLADVALNKALYPPGDPEQRFATPKTVGALTLADVKSWFATGLSSRPHHDRRHRRYDAGGGKGDR